MIQPASFASAYTKLTQKMQNRAFQAYTTWKMSCDKIRVHDIFPWMYVQWWKFLVTVEEHAKDDETTVRIVLTYLFDLFLQLIGSIVILSIRSVSMLHWCETCLCRFGVWTIQNCTSDVSIVLSQGFCVSKLEFEPLHSRLHLRQVGVIDRKEFALQVSIQNFLVQRNRTWIGPRSLKACKNKGPNSCKGPRFPRIPMDKLRHSCASSTAFSKFFNLCFSWP